MGVFVLEGDVDVFVGRGVGLVGVVDFGVFRVVVGDVEGFVDDEGFFCIAFGVICVLGL